MCGICGAIALEGPLRLPAGAAERAIGSLRHRGSDEYGAWRDGRVWLGHARLSIIDLRSGQQPLGSADGQVQVTFNGEIFNYIELRDELRGLGHAFRTDSDTEVIVAAYRQWGISCLDRFNGQFALALYDAPRRRVVLARDRFGIRPLYWARHGDVLLFGSEIKALGAWPGFALRFDPTSLQEIFTYWVTISPATPFHGVEQLPAGHFLTVDLGGGNRRAEITPHRYWYPRFLPAAEDHRFVGREEARRMARAVREKLAEATILRLRADVPVGAYLSGGLDSSATAALVCSETDRALKTFSVGFTDAAYDETRWQQIMARHLGTDHQMIRVGDRDIATSFPRVVWHAETPLLRTAPAPLYALSSLVQAQGYKVVLTGEGADEVFCGYNIFREAKVRAFWARDPGSPRRPLLLTRLYPYLKQSPPAFLARFYGQGLDRPDEPLFSHRPRWQNTAGLLGFLDPELQAAPRAAAAEQRLLDSLPPEFAEWGPVARAQYLEMTTFLSGYLLTSQGDRMLMGHTVEGRFPFLDHELAELAGSLPAAAKLAGLEEKALLKQAVADLLPREIVTRPKQPYRAPDSSSFMVGAGAELVRDLLSPESVAETGLLQQGRVSGLLRKWEAGKLTGARDNMAFVGLLSAQLLARQFGEAFERHVRLTTLPPGAVAWRGGTTPDDPPSAP
jgi:asparagine synthase (glutamine-hydrolyzing)